MDFKNALSSGYISNSMDITDILLYYSCGLERKVGSIEHDLWKATNEIGSLLLYFTDKSNTGGAEKAEHLRGIARSIQEIKLGEGARINERTGTIYNCESAIERIEKIMDGLKYEESKTEEEQDDRRA